MARGYGGCLIKRLSCSALLVGLLAAGCQERSTPRADAHPPDVQTIASAAVENGRLALPNERASVKFAVFGDSGRGSAEQHEVARQMLRYREAFDYQFVLMLGDNIYEGPASPEDYRLKFEEPYRELLRKNVRFFAVLGNHDDPRQVSYAPFNMEGERYHSFSPPEDLLTRLATQVEFFALDSTNLDRTQLAWLDERLDKSDADWKVVFLHHPLYTSGRYRLSSRAHRWVLEPILLRHRVDVVFSGHEHIYQRSTLQQGVQYFVSGGGGASLRLGDGTPASFIARSYASDYHFMLIEIADDALHFQAIARSGATVDAGVLRKVKEVQEVQRVQEAPRVPATR